MNNHKKIIAAIEEKYQGEEKQKLINELEIIYDNDLFLNALECNGVDNWEWYDEVAREYNEWREENDKMQKMQI